MQMCYPNIEFIMDIDDEVLEYKVVRICIQPLIENAIYHGMAGDKNGQIHLKMLSSGDRLIITVKDNGRGMEEEQQRKILDSINNDGELDNNIGLGNIYRRLKLFFGDGVDFKINSGQDIGTIIGITLPKI